MARHAKNILIEPKLQLKLISYFLGLFVLTTLTFYATAYLFFWRLQDKALKVGIPEDHVFFNFLGNLKYDFDMLFLALVIFNFVLLLFIGFRVSHRITGPFYKLKKYLSNLSRENEKFVLRKNDFFKEIEPIVNDLKDSTSKKTGL